MLLPGYSRRFLDVDVKGLDARWNPGDEAAEFSKYIVGYDVGAGTDGTICMAINTYLVRFDSAASGGSVVVNYPLFLVGDRLLVPSFTMAYHHDVLELCS